MCYTIFKNYVILYLVYFYYTIVHLNEHFLIMILFKKLNFDEIDINSQLKMFVQNNWSFKSS